MSQLLARFHAIKAGEFVRPPAPVAWSRKHAVRLTVDGCYVPGLRIDVDSDAVHVHHDDGESTVSRSQAAQLIRRIRAVVRSRMAEPDYGIGRHGHPSAAQAECDRSRAARSAARHWFDWDAGRSIGDAVDDRPESAPDGFNPAAALRLVADSLDRLRGCDLFRLFDSLPVADHQAMGAYILAGRPDLAEGFAVATETIAAERPDIAAPAPRLPSSRMDRVIAFPCRVSIRIFGDRSGAIVSTDDGDRSLTRYAASQYIRGIRAGLRKAHAKRERAAEAYATGLAEAGKDTETPVSGSDAVGLRQAGDSVQDDANPVPSSERGTGAILDRNAAGTALELRWPGKPDAETRAALKAAGWRWSRRSLCWYHRATPENEAVARRFAGSAVAGASPVPETPVSSIGGPDVDAIYEDQCRDACGL